MKLNLVKIATIAALLGSFTVNSIAQDKANILTDVLTSYKRGDYIETLEKIKPLKANDKTKGLAYYWEGVVQTKLQNFDKANDSFEIAQNEKFDSTEFNFEYAQSLFAADRLQISRREFGKSFKKRYKMATSLYYIAYISHALGDYPLAIKYYKKVAELPSDLKKGVEQSAMYQLGEIYHAEAKKNPSPRKMVTRFVIPQFEVALDADSSSKLAMEIEQKIYQLKKEYNLITTKMINGRPVPKKRYSANVALSGTYNNNVVLEADEATTHANKKGSLIYMGSFFGNYQMPFLDIIMITPEVYASKTIHGESNESNIYQNDNESITPAIRNSWEHLLFGEMASFLFDFEYSYYASDYTASKDVKFNSRSLIYSAGERFKIFSFGDSTFKLKKSYSYPYDPATNSVTTTINLSQMARTPMGNTLVVIANLNYLRNNDPSSDTNSLNLIANYVIPQWKNYDMPTFGLATTFTDTKLQKASRGTEIMLNPFFNISKIFDKKYKLTWKVDYTKQSSKNKQSNAYTKWTTGLELAYNF